MKTLSQLDPSPVLKKDRLRYRISVWVLALSVIPLAVVGGGIYWSGQSIQQQLRQAAFQDNAEQSTLNAAVLQQQQALLAGTGGIALLTGVIAILWVNHVMRRLQRLSALSPDGRANTSSSRDQGASADAPLTAMQQMKADAGILQTLTTAQSALKVAESEQAILEEVVTRLQSLLAVDRALVYRFNPDWSGTVAAEAAKPGVRAALDHTIADSCFTKPEWVEKYQNGHIQVLEDVLTAALSECHLKQLEYYEVKAMVAFPIVTAGKLYALLIGHQCAEPRHWHEREIALCQQLADAVGSNIEQRLLKTQVSTSTEQMAQFGHLFQQLQTSPSLDALLQTALTDIRTALKGDRVLFYQVHGESAGKIIAESVHPDWPAVLSATGQVEVSDPCCTAAQILDRYPTAQVQSIEDIYAAPLQDCYRTQLEQYSVEAMATAPVFGADHTLHGLLIVHQCGKPRSWQPNDLNFLTQAALQIGLALEQHQRMSQAEQQCHALQQELQDYTQQSQALQQQWATTLADSQNKLHTLTTTAFQQTTLVDRLFDQVQQMTQALQALMPELQQGIEHIKTVHGSALEASLQQAKAPIAHCLETFAQPSPPENSMQPLGDAIATLKSGIAQIKLQALNATLEATRMGEAGQYFATIGEAVHALSRHLDADLAALHPLIATPKPSASGASPLTQATQLQASATQIEAALEHTQHLQTYLHQMTALTQTLTDTLFVSPNGSAALNEALVDVAQQTSRISDLSAAIAQSLEQLTHMTQDPALHHGAAQRD